MRWLYLLFASAALAGDVTKDLKGAPEEYLRSGLAVLTRPMPFVAACEALIGAVPDAADATLYPVDD